MSQEIKLNKIEYEHLLYASFLPVGLQSLLFSRETHGDIYLLRISSDQADEIRDLCGEQLQLVGFDENYELTAEGEILESLIDQFFIG